MIDEAAVEAGRTRGDVRRLYNVSGSLRRPRDGFLQGPPAVWVEQLAGLALDEGISGFVLMADADRPARPAPFAEEVAPGVRELVEAERLAPGTASRAAGSPCPWGPEAAPATAGSA